MELNTELAVARQGFAKMRYRQQFQAEQVSKLNTRMTALEEEKAALVKAVGVIDRTIEIVSANGIGKIEQVVSNGMRLVFDDQTMGLRIEKKETARGNTYSLVPYQGGTSGPALETFGGGVVNVIGFLLRVIMIKRFGLAKYLVVDEAFNNVSGDFQPMVSEMLSRLCHENGYTIFAVSHQPILTAAADHVYRLEPGVDGPPNLVKLSESEMQELRVTADRLAAG